MSQGVFAGELLFISTSYQPRPTGCASASGRRTREFAIASAIALASFGLLAPAGVARAGALTTTWARCVGALLGLSTSYPPSLREAGPGRSRAAFLSSHGRRH